MARPRKSDNSKAALLQVGTQMLTEQGYHGTGIKPVLDRVGVPKGSFYNFFESKEHFVANIIESYGEVELRAFEEDIAGLEQAPAMVQLWCSFQNRIQRKLNANESCACLLGAMAAEIASASERCRQSIDRVETVWVKGLSRYIALAQQQGDFKLGACPDDLARLLYNCSHGALLQYQVSNNHNDLLANLYVFFNLIFSPQGEQIFQQSDVCKREIQS